MNTKQLKLHEFIKLCISNNYIVSFYKEKQLIYIEIEREISRDAIAISVAATNFTDLINKSLDQLYRNRWIKQDEQ